MSDRSHAAFDERLLRDVDAQTVRYGGNSRPTARREHEALQKQHRDQRLTHC